MWSLESLSDFQCTVVTHKESDMHYTTYGCLNYNQAFMEIAYCEGGREGNSDKTNMRTYCCTGELCNNVTAPSIPSTTTPQHSEYKLSFQSEEAYEVYK